MTYGTAPGGGGGGGGTSKTSKKSSSSNSGSGGGGGIKKSNDKPQRDALKALLGRKGFKRQLNSKLANITGTYGKQDATILKGYDERTGVLLTQKDANEAASGAASQGNLQNRARETSDILANAAAQGAGETDTLRAKHMALNNWAANQAEVDRSYFDTRISNNAAISELNSDTYQSRFNLANQMLSDTESTYANYYNQMADAATQLGNLQANPYSNAYSKKGAKNAWAKMKKYAKANWDNPGVDPTVAGWEGSMKTNSLQTNSGVLTEDGGEPAQKRPEGTTLTQW